MEDLYNNLFLIEEEEEEEEIVPQGSEGAPEAPAMLEIGGEKYSPDDVQKYITRAREIENLEKQWNTPIDRVMPAFTRATQERNQLQSQLEEAQRQLSQRQSQGIDQSADYEKVREAAKKAGILTSDDVKQAGYLTRDEVLQLMQEQREQERFERQVNKDLDALMKDIEGNGKPWIPREAILSSMATYNIEDPKQAYERLMGDKLKEWQTAQVEANKKRGFQTLKSGGQKNPPEVKPTLKNMSQLMEDYL